MVTNDNPELQVRSWSKPAGIPNLIGRKRVDWSIFTYGSQIPVEFHQFFEAANGGQYLEKGESHEIQLIFEERTFNAKLYNQDRNVETDTLVLQWRDKDFKDLLISRFSSSYTYLENERKTVNESGIGNGLIKIPDYQAEYIDFISTDTSFTYLLDFITVNNYPNIWWVNQGSSLTAEREKGILYAPLHSKDGRIIYHWENMKELKVGDIVVHYANNALRYVSKITSAVIETEDSHEHENYERGRLVRTNYYELNPVVDIQGIAQRILKLDISQGPIDSSERVKQGYLFKFNYEGLKFIQESQPSTTWPEWATFDNHIENGNITTELDYSGMVSSLIENIASRGFIFEPWQIATYVTALRTKPFVILAGVSGTGKSKLPALISQATGGKCHLIPVRPDWTDSSDVLGYSDLQGQFKPGAMLSIVREATDSTQRHFVCIMDEMNLARVEHYFAEVLSQVENRHQDETGNYFSGPLICQDLREEDKEWGQLVLPPNLAIVGTVNMDESAYGFSRKVLDRAFTLELSEIHLDLWENEIDENPGIDEWPVNFWYPRAINLNGIKNISAEDKQKIDEVIKVLTEVNTILIQAQLQVGYRVRDEVALFVLHAEDIIDSFVTRDKMQVKPLDLALQMKILPRIIGGSTPIRKVVLQLLGWAVNGSKNISEEDAQKIIEDWDKNGRLTFLENASYPRTAARLCLMWERLVNEGFTSFWM